MSGVKKCSYYNVDHCKFPRKENGCKIYHPEECCQLLNFIDTDCLRRQPRTCKFGETCIFQNNCLYKHVFGDINKDMVDMSKQVEIVKAEI